MAEIINFSARHDRSTRTRAIREMGRINSAVERYDRASRDWQLNPKPRTVSNRVKALLGVLEAREELSGLLPIRGSR